jgi:1,4-dihydroxy-2-naphthoate octaprenyltransferase
MATHLSSKLDRPSLLDERFWRGVWRVADPKITLASAASMLLGTALAAADGPISWGWLAAVVAGIFCIEAAKNASGEIFDWDSGADLAVAEADRSPFSGGKRILVDRLVTRRQAIGIAAAFYALGGAAGLAVVLLREPAVLALGVAGVALAYFYHAPPLRLSYRGLGEIAVALTYGPLICAGTYLVQRHTAPPRVWLASLPLGILVGAFLWINEFPDRRADATAGKRTLVVRLGAARASTAYAGIVAAALVALLLLPLAGLPPAVLFGAVGFLPLFAAARRLRASPEVTARVVAAQGWTLLGFVLVALAMSIGLVIAALV